MNNKEYYNCTSVDDVCEQLKKGEYVFTYVELKNKKGIKFINAYHLCDYGLEAFSFDRNSNELPLKLQRADVRFVKNIENLYMETKKHIAARFDKFKAFVVCDDLLDLENIPKPCRFKEFCKNWKKTLLWTKKN